MSVEELEVVFYGFVCVVFDCKFIGLVVWEYVYVNLGVEYYGCMFVGLKIVVNIDFFVYGVFVVCESCDRFKFFDMWKDVCKICCDVKYVMVVLGFYIFCFGNVKFGCDFVFVYFWIVDFCLLDCGGVQFCFSY